MTLGLLSLSPYLPPSLPVPPSLSRSTRSRGRSLTSTSLSSSRERFRVMIRPLPMRRVGRVRGMLSLSRSLLKFEPRWVGRVVLRGVVTLQPCPKLRRWGLRIMPSLSSFKRSLTSPTYWKRNQQISVLVT